MPNDALAANETDKTLTAIDEIARRARGEHPGLPHPFETDRKLSAHLSAATAAASGATQSGWRGRIERTLLERFAPSILAFDRELIDIVHQLDHRDRQQREEIADLHQQVADLRQRLDTP